MTLLFIMAVQGMSIVSFMWKCVYIDRNLNFCLMKMRDFENLIDVPTIFLKILLHHIFSARKLKKILILYIYVKVSL